VNVEPEAADQRLPGNEQQLEAERARQRALRFWDLQSFRAARDEFEKAYRLSPRPLFLYNLAVTSMALSDAASAYEYFESYLRLGADSISDERRAMVTRQLQDLQDHVATIVVRTDGPVSKIAVDGSSDWPKRPGQGLLLNVGTHTVIVRRADGKVFTRTLTLRGGQTLIWDLRSSEQERLASHAAARQRWLIAGWSATAALGVGAALSGLQALSAQRDYEAELTRIGATRTSLDRLDARAQRWSVTADALAGGALIAGVCSLYFSFARAPASARSETAFATKLRRVELRVSPQRVSVTTSF
jgi:hypothetical protein